MTRIFLALAVTAMLAGCDGENPFMIDAVSPDGETEEVDPRDPNVTVGNKFAFDIAANITMNSVAYDQANDQLVINNLPFDGPDGRYDNVPGERTTNANGQVRDIYQNREVVIPGEMQYYAVFLESDYLEATSAAGRNWGDFGFAGANVNRESFRIPAAAQESYEYVGIYAATRTYDERGGIELIAGDVRLLLDVTDLDPNFPGEGLQGLIVGTVTNRTRNPVGDTMVGDLPNISLESVSFNTATGVWEGGQVSTFYDGEQRDDGIHEGLIAGPNGEELGGYLVMEGVADIQTVAFQIVNWTLVTETPGPFGPITVTTTGTTSGLALADRDFIQAQVNLGIPVGTLSVSASDLPDGATVNSTQTDFIDIETEFNAREIGVFVTDLNP